MLKQLAEQYNLVLNLTAVTQRHNEVVKEKQHSETKKRRLWACFCFHSESQVQANLLFTRQLILSESAQQQDRAPNTMVGLDTPSWQEVI